MLQNPLHSTVRITDVEPYAENRQIEVFWIVHGSSGGVGGRDVNRKC
jgi:hypothetical protein